MLTIEHSKYPKARELRNLIEHVRTCDVVFPPPYIMAAMRLQYAIDEGAEMALATNAIVIKWDGKGSPHESKSDVSRVMERLMYSEDEDNYLIDTATPALI